MKTRIEKRQLGRIRHYAIMAGDTFLCHLPTLKDAKAASFRATGSLALCAVARLPRDRAIQYARDAALDCS